MVDAVKTRAQKGVDALRGNSRTNWIAGIFAAAIAASEAGIIPDPYGAAVIPGIAILSTILLPVLQDGILSKD